jgi:uncharacterized damage-inducible protein DinB
MTDSEIMLQEFDTELQGTRKVLERIPMDKLDFKPHEKSTALGRLATHVATLGSLAVTMMEQDEMDMSKADPSRFTRVIKTREELLQELDDVSGKARAAIASATPEQWQGKWTFRMGERVFFSLPRAQVYRTMYMNHLIHHRAQLTVYLRLLDVPVPGMYGPTADEGM